MSSSNKINRRNMNVRGIGGAVPSGFVVGGAKDGRAVLLPIDPQGTVGGGGASGGSGGGATGTVTNVATGTGLTGGPITTTGTIALANTAVTPAAYTNTNLTVDAQGRITAAANGTDAGITQLTGDVTAGPGSGSQAATVVHAPASGLTGTTLAAAVVTSSLTALGTLITGIWNATKIALQYGGTNADLHLTGGAHQVLQQSSAGAAVTVGQLANTDISGLGTMSTQNASAVAITGGTETGLTGLAIRDTSAAFDVTLAAVSSAALTAGRTLTFDVKNVAHTIALGSTANTITFPNAASYTVGGLSVAQTWTAAQTYSSTVTLNTLTAGSVLFSGTGGLLSQDNTNLFWDATNHRLGLGLTNPVSSIDITGSYCINNSQSLAQDANYNYFYDRGANPAIIMGNGGSADAQNYYRNTIHTFQTIAGGATVAVFKTTGAYLVGTTTNDNVAAGGIGEYVSSDIASASAVNLPTAAITDITTISLTAGDWDVEGNIVFVPIVNTIITNPQGWVNNAAGAPAQEYRTSIDVVISNATLFSLIAPRQRFSLATTTTIHLSAFAAVTVSTATVYGQISARRVR